MMKAAEWISIYGALLATILGFLRVHEFLNAKRHVRVQLSHLVELPSNSLDLVVTNRASFEIEVDHLWVGYAYRSWLMPWKRRMGDATGVIFFELNGFEQIGADGKIKPGQRLFGHLSIGETYERRRRWIDRRGFDHRLAASICHSASSRDHLSLLG